jgi:ketosteroid isomerase-like protein
MSDTALTPIDRETIRVIAEDHWTTALVSGDVDRLLALCAADVVYMPADHAALHGHDELRRWLSAFPRVASMTQPIEWLDGTSQQATARVSFTAALDVEGQRVQSSGKALCCLRKNDAGQWLVKSVCWNFDQPSAAMLPNLATP